MCFDGIILPRPGSPPRRRQRVFVSSELVPTPSYRDSVLNRSPSPWCVGRSADRPANRSHETVVRTVSKRRLGQAERRLSFIATTDEGDAMSSSQPHGRCEDEKPSGDKAKGAHLGDRCEVFKLPMGFLPNYRREGFPEGFPQLRRTTSVGHFAFDQSQSGRSRRAQPDQLLPFIEDPAAAIVPFTRRRHRSSPASPDHQPARSAAATPRCQSEIGCRSEILINDIIIVQQAAVMDEIKSAARERMCVDAEFGVTLRRHSGVANHCD